MYGTNTCTNQFPCNVQYTTLFVCTVTVKAITPSPPTIFNQTHNLKTIALLTPTTGNNVVWKYCKKNVTWSWSWYITDINIVESNRKKKLGIGRMDMVDIISTNKLLYEGLPDGKEHIVLKRIWKISHDIYDSNRIKLQGKYYPKHRPYPSYFHDGQA